MPLLHRPAAMRRPRLRLRLLLVFLVLAFAGCSRDTPHRQNSPPSPPSPPLAARPTSPAPADAATPPAREPPPRADTEPRAALPSAETAPRPAPGTAPANVLTPRPDLVSHPDRVSLLVFGDSRIDRSLCDPPRAKPIPCPLRAARGAAAAHLCDRARGFLSQEVVDALQPPKAPQSAARARDDFALFTGDLVYRGSCPKDWADIRRTLLDRLPEGRFFPAPGNHDVWQRRGEPDPIRLYADTFPFLARGEGEKRSFLPYYAFRAGPALVVTLDTGGYPKHGDAQAFLAADRRFLSPLASFDEQRRWLGQILEWGAKQGVRHVLLQYHKPSFTASAHPPLDEAEDPIAVLRPFKRAHPAINVLAFVGHNHTTEVHVSGGVLHLVAGGGGARQYLSRSAWGKRGQPEERFWAGAPLALRYNLFRIVVNGPRLEIQERCVAWRNGRVVVEDGARISPEGTVTHRKGACLL